MTLRDEIEKILNRVYSTAIRNTGGRPANKPITMEEALTAILQAVEKVVPEEQVKLVRPGKPQNSRFNKRIEGFNQCRSAMLRR